MQVYPYVNVYFSRNLFSSARNTDIIFNLVSEHNK